MFDAIADYVNVAWLYRGLMIAYAVTTVGIICVVLSENRNPVKSLAWVTVLLLLPLVGIVLYLFFGRNVRNTRMISRRNRRKLRRRARPQREHFDDAAMSNQSDAVYREINLGRSLEGAPCYPDNNVKVYTDGESKFADFLADLASARSFINLQYYIIEDDDIGTRVRDILVERAAAGVVVRVIYDHVGSWSVRSSFFKDLRRCGVQAYPFFKVSFPLLGTRINWRNHRKICVIDGRVGYLGGMNIADRYITGGRFAVWRDTHVRVTGSVVAALQYSFAVDWSFMGQPLIEDQAVADGGSPAEPDAAGSGEVAGVAAQMLTAGPTSQWSNIAMMFHMAIANARRRVYIETPYFLPTDVLLKDLLTAALAHVDVRIIMPRKSDSLMLTYASASYIAECLRGGVKIYFYEPGMLHSKAMVIDDEICSVGSTNFDFRSFEHNFESNLFFYSREFNARMRAIFRDDMAKCTRVTAAEWRKRPTGHKVLESIIRLLSPIL